MGRLGYGSLLAFSLRVCGVHNMDGRMREYPNGICEVWGSEDGGDVRKWIRVYTHTQSPGSRLYIRETEGAKHPHTIVLFSRSVSLEKHREFTANRWKHVTYYTPEEFLKRDAV